jgi:hypothetical protein
MAIIANIFIDQGTDFSITVDVTDTSGGALNMSGYSAAAQIRKTYGSSTVSSSFTTSIAEASGQVTLSLTDTQTTALESGRYVYDLNVTSGGGQTTRVVEGQAIVTPGVTR